jgi:hypothetical protein|tara:strand:- start:3137 stop:3319 length:183 start_codon:yes stop_codon:yes gene_type:complete
MKEPEDLGVEVGTTEQAAWTELKERAEKDIATSKRAILMDDAIIKLAETMIEAERKAMAA